MASPYTRARVARSVAVARPSLATRVAAAAKRALASLALLVGLALGALVPSAAARDGAPTRYDTPRELQSGLPDRSATAAHVIGWAPAVDYSAGLTASPIRAAPQ